MSDVSNSPELLVNDSVSSSSQTQNSSSVLQEKKDINITKKVLLVLAFGGLIAFFSVAAYYLGKNDKLSFLSDKNPTVQEDKNLPNTSTKIPEQPLFSGKLRRIEKDLEVLKVSEDTESSGGEFCLLRSWKVFEGRVGRLYANNRNHSSLWRGGVFNFYFGNK